MCENIHSLHFKTGLTTAFCFFYRGPCLWCSHPYLTHQLKKINELIGIFPCGQVQEVSWDSVGQTWAGLHSDFTGGGTECRSVLIKYKMRGVNTAAHLSKIQAVQCIWKGFEDFFFYHFQELPAVLCLLAFDWLWDFCQMLAPPTWKAKSLWLHQTGWSQSTTHAPLEKQTCNYFHTY